MHPTVARLYGNCPTLKEDYVRDILKLSGDQADLVAKINGGISKTEAELICDLVAELEPTVTLEVGLGYGFSALSICSSTPEVEGRKHIVIDPYQYEYWDGLGLQHLDEAGFGAIVEHHTDLSYKVLPRLLEAGTEIDFAFIDGWHTFDFVSVDFFYIDKMLRNGGIVAFDDADWPSIRPLLRYIVSNLPYNVVGTLPEKRQREDADIKLGLEGSCIALSKDSNVDSREIFFHRSF